MSQLTDALSKSDRAACSAFIIGMPGLYLVVLVIFQNVSYVWRPAILVLGFYALFGLMHGVAALVRSPQQVGGSDSIIQSTSCTAMLLAAPITFVAYWLSTIEPRRRVGSPLKCVKCGYDLRGQVEARCPECGERFDPELLTGKRPGG